MFQTSASIIGVPLDLGAANLGVAAGPEAFRTQGIIKKLVKAGIAIEDIGDIAVAERASLDPGNTKLRYLNEIVRVSNEAARASEGIIQNNRKVIALGGDHSINLGVVSGASAALSGDLGLIYLDAHGDANTPETTQSGNIHGMHLASLLGFGAPELIDVHIAGRKIAPEHLLHIGGSDFDAAELAFMKQEKFPMFTLLDLLSHNLAPLLSMIEALQSKVRHLWVSLDLDVIDEVYAPGAAMPNRKGLSYREVSAIAEAIGGTGKVIGVDVVEYNPSQDKDHKTAELGIELIAKFLGHNYSWYTNYMERNTITA